MSRYLIRGEGGLGDVGGDLMMVKSLGDNLRDCKVSLFKNRLFLDVGKGIT